jgi:predicted nucleic acid-binding protein
VNALVDTSVWSLALRRKNEDLNAVEKATVVELTELVREGRARIIGLVRQELLSGIRNPAQYEKIRASLRTFRDEMIDTSDHEAAAKANNDCRAQGVVVTTVDVLLCAIASSRGWSIFTTDFDFKNYANILPIKLHVVRK